MPGNIEVIIFTGEGDKGTKETVKTFEPADENELARFLDGEPIANIIASRIDFYFEDQFSIILIHPLTDAAQEHADEIFPDALHMGAAIAVEPRFATDLIYRLHNDGFKVCAFGQEILEITPR